jgi:hypothetical protein
MYDRRVRGEIVEVGVEEEDSGRESRGVEKFVEVTVTEDWKITVESSE